MKILFTQEVPCIRNYKLAKALKEKDIKVSLACHSMENTEALDSNIYHQIIHIDSVQQLQSLLRDYDIIHCHNEPDLITTKCFNEKVPVIHDCHDLVSLRGFKSQIKIRSYLEKRANIYADGRIYVSTLQMEEAIRLYNIDIRRSLIFPNYILKDAIPKTFKPKLSNVDGKIHIVYIGSLSHGKTHRNFLSIFEELSKKEFHIHIYPVSLKCIQPYKNKFKSNPKVHCYNPVHPDSLIHEISQYDFGIIPFRRNQFNIRHLDSMMPHKLFEYLAAKLPIISVDLQELNNYISTNNVGILYNSVEDIVNSIDKLKKIQIIKKVSTIEDEIDKLINFYKEIIKWKKKQ